MYRAIRITMLAAIAALGADAAQANLLVNGNLDSPPDHETDVAVGWILEEPGVDGLGAPVNSATFASFANHTPAGERGLWLRSFVGGSGVNPPTVTAHLYQDVPGGAGIAYSLIAWFRMEPNYSGLNPAASTQTILAIDFLNAADSVIASVELDIDTVYVPDNTWQQFPIGGVAPAGTTTVRARASMLDGLLQPANPQSAFIDDFVLVPEPTSLALLILGLFAPRRRR